MSGRSTGVEWVETTEEVVITECIPPENNTPAGNVMISLIISHLN